MEGRDSLLPLDSSWPATEAGVRENREMARRIRKGGEEDGMRDCLRVRVRVENGRSKVRPLLARGEGSEEGTVNLMGPELNWGSG